MAANAGAYAGVWRWRKTLKLPDGGFVVYSEASRYNTVHQRLESMLRTEEFAADGDLRLTNMMHLELAYLTRPICVAARGVRIRGAAHFRRFSRPRVRTRRG